MDNPCLEDYDEQQWTENNNLMDSYLSYPHTEGVAVYVTHSDFAEDVLVHELYDLNQTFIYTKLPHSPPENSMRHIVEGLL